MIRKVYGVSGLMDWTTNINVGKAAVSVHFTGGALTAYGVTPAKYATANPFFQHVIENSDQFKNGRIKLLDVMEVPDDAATKERKARAARLAAAKAMPPAPQEEQDKKDDAETTAPATAETSDTEVADGDDAADYSIVEVADKNDAVEWLKEHSDIKYTATQLRTKTAFEAACKENRVKFVFTAAQ